MTGANLSCTRGELSVNTANTLGKITWYKDGAAITTVTAPPRITTVVAGVEGFDGEPQQFGRTEGMSLDANGNFYIADDFHNRVQKWAPGATSGVTVAGGNGAGSNPDQLNVPHCLYIDDIGNLYVSDAGNNRVQKWAPGATSGVTVAGGNGQGGVANQFDLPMGLYVDKSGNIFVADYTNNRIQKWAPGATSGVTVAGGNGWGSAPNQLKNPSALYIDGNGNMYISDQTNCRIQKWTPGATSGVTVAGGNGEGSAPNQLYAPNDVYVDNNGNIYIDDYSNNRIQKWAPGATSGITVAGGNGWGSAMDQLAFPFCIYLDAAGNLYVSDQYNYRVQKYALPSPIDRNYTAVEAGSYTAQVTDINDCISTTNAIIIGAAVTPSVSIDAPTSVVCAGSPVTFTATAVNGGSSPVFQWQVNGINKGPDSDAYIDPSPANGSVITCTITSNATCTTAPTAVSAPVTLAVNPIVTPGLTIEASATTISLGSSVDFIAFPINGGDNPVFQWQVNGTATGMNSPRYTSSNLSDGDIVICTITSNAACATTSKASSVPVVITVKDHPRSGIPNAFTPNGDGNNDVFYMPGGPAGTTIREFAIFNRWGQRIFEVHGVPPGNKNYGWNGSYHGTPLPPGTYAYIIETISSDGKSQVSRGTVVLIR